MNTEEAAAAKQRQGSAVTPHARPRLGFLGVGWIGRNRLQAIVRSGVADIVAIADSASELAEQAAAEQAEDALMLNSLDELLDARLDGVVIATPSALHAEQCVQALGRGAAVFCQKPLGRTAAETQAVVEAARQANLLLGVDLSYRAATGMRLVRELVRSGELGSIFAARMTFHNAYGPDKKWFYDPQLSGGGCVIDLGVHLVDLTLWTLDFPRVIEVSSRLYANGELLRSVDGRPNRVEDYAVAQIVVDSGAVIELACSWNLNAGQDALIEAAFYGTQGGAALRNVDGSFYDFTAERFRGTARETLASPPDEWSGRAAVEWTERLAAGARFDDQAERLVDVASALDAIYG